MNQNNLSKIALPLFVLWPLGSFILALQSVKKRSSAIVIVLFCGLFGYAMSFTDDSADSYRIAWGFANYRYDSFSLIFERYLSGRVEDIYEYVLFILVKSFTDNPKVLFAFCGLVFGFFFYLSLKLLVKEKRNYNDVYLVILAIVFFSLNPITNINGFRFWTATWVAFYGIMMVFYYSKKKYLPIFILPILIHFAFVFIIPIIILLVFFNKILANHKSIRSVLYILFFLTFLLSILLKNTNAIPVGNLVGSDLVSDSIIDKVDVYKSDRITDAYVERGQSIFQRVSKFTGLILKCLFVVIIFHLKKVLKIVGDVQSEKLMSLILVFSIFGFLVSSVPSGSRFVIIPFCLTIVLFVRLYVRHPSKKMKSLIRWLVPASSFKILFGIGFLSYRLVSSTIYYGNVFWVIYEGVGFKVRYTL